MKQLAAQGRVSDIEAMEGVELVPGNKGTTVRALMGDEVDRLIETAEQQALQDHNRSQGLKTLEIKESLQFYYDDPTPANRAEAISILRGIGTEAALTEARRITGDNGVNYDPDKHFELVQDTAAGNPPTEAELKTLLDNGIISDEEYKYHSQSDEDKQLRADIDAHIRTQQSNIKSSLAGNHDSSVPITPQDLKGQFGTEFNNRAEYLKNDIAEALMVMAQSDPSILTDPRKMQAAQEQAMQAILQRPEYRMTNDQQNGWSFNADANPQVNMTAVTAVDGNQDFSKLTADQLFNQSGIPLAQMNPTEDRFFSKDVLRVETEKYLTHGYVSKRANDIAAKLGITPKALLDAQNAATGFHLWTFSVKRLK